MGVVSRTVGARNVGSEDHLLIFYRPRFTSRVLEELLGGTWNLKGPISPLRTLNACIEAWAGCEPLLYPLDMIAMEPGIGSIDIDTFRWEKLKKCTFFLLVHHQES